MSLFDDMLGHEESLFKDEFILDLDYMPDILPYRENQQKAVADAIKPLMAKRTGDNLFIYGAPGIGKTSCVRFIFNELKKNTDKICTIYVNCWEKPTTNNVLAEIASKMGGIATLYKTNEELWQKIDKNLNRYQGFVLALDEIDKAKEFDFIYALTERLRNIVFLLITNEPDFLARLDGRIRSRLNLVELEFKPYKRNEVEGILKERREAAFVPNVWTPEAVESVVDKTYKKEDIRVGLFLMREAGRKAEKKASRKITSEHVLEATNKLIDFKIEVSSGFTEREKVVLDIVRKNPGIESGELSKKLNDQGHDIPESTLRRIANKLDREGYIFREETTVQGRGKTMKHFCDE